MKEELVKLLVDFKREIRNVNEAKPVFEDDVEYSLENFYRWLTFKEEENA